MRAFMDREKTPKPSDGPATLAATEEWGFCAVVLVRVDSTKGTRTQLIQQQ